MKKLDKKVLNTIKEKIDKPDFNFKELHLKLNTKSTDIKKERLVEFCKIIAPKIKNVDRLDNDKKFIVETLEKLYFKIEELKVLKDKNDKHSLFKLKSSIPKTLEYLNRVELELKYLFDIFETMFHVITFDLTSSMSFNKMIDMLFDNNMLDYKEYNLLKLFSKIRNLFMHNNDNVIGPIFLLLDDIPLYMVLLEEINKLQIVLIQKFQYRISLTNQLLFYNCVIPDHRIYDFLCLQFLVRKQEYELKIKTLKFNPSIFNLEKDIENDLDGSALILRYNSYVGMMIQAKNEELDLTHDELEEHVNKHITHHLEKEFNRNTRLDLHRALEIRLDPRYVTDDVSGMVMRNVDYSNYKK